MVTNERMGLKYISFESKQSYQGGERGLANNRDQARAFSSGQARDGGPCYF